MPPFRKKNIQITGKYMLYSIIGFLCVIGISRVIFIVYQDRLSLQSQIKSSAYVPFHKQNTFLHLTDSVQPLRLQRFWLQTIYDPILAIPSVNIENLSRSVNNIRSSEYKYLSFYTPSEQKLIKESLLPTPFLASLAPLELSRRNFIEHPSVQSAVSYNRRLLRSLTLAESYTRQLTIALSGLKLSSTTIAFPAGNTSTVIINKKLRILMAQLNDQKHKERERSNCLLHSLPRDSCAITIPNIITRYSSTSKTVKMSGYNQAISAYLTNVYNIHTLRTPKNTNSFPLIRLQKSSCTYSGQGLYVFAWKPSRGSGDPSLFSTPVNELLFHDTAARKTRFDILMADVGVRYNFQPMNPYMCIDNGTDTSQIRTAYYIQKELIEHPLSEITKLSTSSNISIKKLLVLENRIIRNSQIINVADISNYISQLQTILYLGEFSTILTRRQQLHSLDMITIWRAKSSFLSEDFNRIDDVEATNLNILRSISMPIAPLFITRSYFSTLLLTSNATLYEQPVSFLGPTHKVGLKTMGIVTYENTLRYFIPLDKLSSFMINQNKFANIIYKKK